MGIVQTTVVDDEPNDVETAKTTQQKEEEGKHKMMMNTRLCLASLMLLLLVEASHQQDETGVDGAPADYNIGKEDRIFPDKGDLLLDVAKNSEDFSTLVAALDSVPELKPVFEKKGDKLTVLAPTNEAFETFFKDFNSSAENFLEDPALVKH